MAIEEVVVREGGCLCGSIRYQVHGEPLSFVFCHCRDCQRVSGGSPAAVVMLPKQAFKLIKGELKSFTKTTDRGNLAHRRFCPDCGSQVLSELSIQPQLVFIKAGTLDDPSDLVPKASLWTQSAHLGTSSI